MRKGELTRQQVIEHALVMASERGLEAISLRDVAAESKLSKSALYTHFDSKETMLDEVLRDFLDRLFGEYRAVLAAADAPREQLRGCVIASFAAIDAR